MYRMRIVHLTKYLPTFHGGVEFVTREMTRAGRALGADVTIIGAEEGHKSDFDLDLFGAKTVPLKIYGKIGPVPIVPGFFCLFDEIKAADVLHIHLPNPLAEIALLSLNVLDLLKRKDRPMKLVPIVHAGIVRWPRLGRIWEYLIERKILKLADHFIVAAPQLLECFKTLQEFKHKAVIMPFPVPPSPFDEDKEIDGVPKKGEQILQLLALGRFVRYKGFDVLLDAVAHLKQDFKLTIAGHGPEKKDLLKQIGDLGLKEKVVLKENVSEEEKHELLSKCDISLVPSRTLAECYGLVIAEAFTHKKPVITTTLATGVSFLSRGGSCGDVVKPDAPEELLKAIENLASNPKKRNDAGNENYQFWRKELQPEIFRERYQILLTKYK